MRLNLDVLGVRLRPSLKHKNKDIDFTSMDLYQKPSVKSSSFKYCTNHKGMNPRILYVSICDRCGIELPKNHDKAKGFLCAYCDELTYSELQKESSILYNIGRKAFTPNSSKAKIVNEEKLDFSQTLEEISRPFILWLRKNNYFENDLIYSLPYDEYLMIKEKFLQFEEC